MIMIKLMTYDITQFMVQIVLFYFIKTEITTVKDLA